MSGTGCPREVTNLDQSQSVLLSCTDFSRPAECLASLQGVSAVGELGTDRRVGGISRKAFGKMDAILWAKRCQGEICSTEAMHRTIDMTENCVRIGEIQAVWEKCQVCNLPVHTHSWFLQCESWMTDRKVSASKRA